MTVPRSLLAVAVALALLLLALPVAAGGGNASAAKETGGPTAQTGGGHGTPSPTATGTATTAAPAATNPPAAIRESGGAGDGERTVATTQPTATPSAGSGARAGGTGPAATGGNGTHAGSAVVPTETPASAGLLRSQTPGDGGGAPTASPASTPRATRSAPVPAPVATVVATSAAINGTGSVTVSMAETDRAGRGDGGRTGSGISPVPATPGATSGPADGTIAPGADRLRAGGAVLPAPHGTPGRHALNGTGHGRARGADSGPTREEARPTVAPAGYGHGPGFLARAGVALSVPADRAGRGGAGPDGHRGPARHGDDGGRRGPPATPEPLAPPVRTGLEPPEPAAGRAKKEPLRGPFTADGADGLPDPLLLLRFLLFLGYRRVRPGTLLDHPLRRDLAAAVAADPGLDLAGCVAATGANRETLRYHLALLVCGGRVVEETRNGSVGYFPAGIGLPPAHRALLQLRRNPSLAPVLFHIRDAPGITRRELADRLGVAGPSVTRQVARLAGEGLVERHRCGQSQRYWLTPACAGAFAAIAAAEGVRDRSSVPADRATA